jgi:hypothetical protein
MALKGSRNGKVFHLGMGVQVILKEANPISGSLVLEISGSEGSRMRIKKQKNKYRRSKSNIKK